MNAGKQFEADIKKSCKKQDIFYLRINDPVGFGGEGEKDKKKKDKKVKFTPKNLCDCIMHYNAKTLLVECKSHKGKSIPKDAMKQLDRLLKVNHKDARALFFLNYRELNETYILEPFQIADCLKYRKSVDVGYARKHGTLIEQHKLIKNYEYELIKALEKLL